MNKRIIFINLWPKGGMRHYSNAIVNVISKEDNVFYLSNYKSDVISNNKIIKLSLNIINPLNYIRLIYIVYFLIKIKPDVVHLNNGYPLLFIIYPIFYFFNSIVTVHDAVSHEGESSIKQIYHKIQLWLFSVFFSKIIVHSDKIKKQLPNYVRKSKVEVLPFTNFNYLVQDKIEDKRPGSKFIVLFFGRILEYKGLKYLVEAFDYLDEDKYELVIAGEGKIDSVVRKKNIKVFNRFINDSEIPTFFNNADVVVTPYISASQSGVVYLSFAYNKPVISTKVGSIDDVVIDGNNGILVNSKSSAELSNAIKRISSSALYKQMILNIEEQNEGDDRKILNALYKIYE